MEELEHLFREHWAILGKNGKLNKEGAFDWLRENHPEKELQKYFTLAQRSEIYCFACVEVVNNCKHCPVDWGLSVDGKPLVCENTGALYARWRKEKFIPEKERLAKAISNLPWKDTNQRYIEQAVTLKKEYDQLIIHFAELCRWVSSFGCDARCPVFARGLATNQDTCPCFQEYLTRTEQGLLILDCLNQL